MDTVSPLTAAAASAETQLASAVCRSCGTQRFGAYCHACGQEFTEERLRIRSLIRHSVAQFLLMDRGFLRTAWELTVRPGSAIDKYVSGARRPYMNPVGYLVVTSAISLLLFSFLEQEIAEWFRATSQSNTAYAKVFTPEQNERFVQLTMKTTQYHAYTLLVMSVPFALLLRLFFLNAGRNIAEVSVFTLYILGQVNMIDALLTPIIWFSTGSVGALVYATYPIYIVATAFAAYQFFGRRFFAMVKAWIAFGVSFFAVSIAIIAVIAAYVLLAG